MSRRASALALVALALAACGDDSKNLSGVTKVDPPVGAAPAADPHASLGAVPPAGPPALPSLAWTAPAGWKEGVPISAMRIAQFDVGTDSAGDAVQCIVFGGIGGSDEDNIARWVLQMGPGAKESAVVTHGAQGGTKVTRMLAKGSFTDSMRPGEPKTVAAATMLAAIVELPSGKVHVKLAGESAVVDAAAAQFDAFVASLKPR